MAVPIQLTFRNADATEAIRDEIRDHAQKLELFYSPIMNCRVQVEGPAIHQKRGYSFQVRIRLSLPGGEIVINRAPTLRPEERGMAKAHHHRAEMETDRKNIQGAIKQAFDAARRQLENYARRQRVDVKTHEPAALARVTKLIPVKSCGYIETPDGREIYFHANSVIRGQFKNLKLGSEVSFVEEPGEKGLQASTVKLIPKVRPTRADLPVPAKH